MRMRRRAFLKGAGIAGGVAALSSLGPRRAGAAAKTSPFDRLASGGISVAARLARYEGSHLVSAVDVPLGPRAAVRRDVAGATWGVTLRASAVKHRPDAVELVATFNLLKGRAPEAGVGLAFTFAGWSRDHYLLLPGACYAGNRFESRHSAYPPLLTEPADIGPNVPTIVSDIPRLNVHAGPSRLQVLTGDLATPAAGVHAPVAGTGLLLLTDAATPAGTIGIIVEETDDRAHATLAVTAPGVREDVMYAAGNTRLRSKDRGASFRAGDELTLRVRLHLFDCADAPALLARFFEVRKDVTGASAAPHELPFSAAFKRHEERANQRWVEAGGYYAVGARDGGAYANWQTGWCGGLVATLPLLEAGGARSRERALKNLEFAFAAAQAPSGFFHAVYDGKEWFEDGFTAPRGRPPGGPAYKHARRWHLVRRSADALTFLTRQLMLLDRQDRDRAGHVDARWTKGLIRCADAFVRLWDRYRQLGQFVNIDTGDMVVGGSTSAGLAPAGLALAAAYLKKEDYLRVARAAAQQMYDRWVRAGVTCGGPGDALQCPDSESAAALLESFVTLWEQTGDQVWIDRAQVAAHLLATWVISHDLHPLAMAGGEGAGDLDTTGAVLSDAQNKHGSPGYVLQSGDALLRLYRATGQAAYLELLRDTVHGLGQYLPRAEAAAAAAAVARGRDQALAACARADTSDWLDPVGDVVPVGGVFDTASLLAYAEVPGLYVQTDAGFVFAFDHVDARVKEKTAERLVVTLANPTRSDAAVRILAETAPDAAKPLAPGAVLSARVVTVPAGGSTDVDFAALAVR